MNERHLAAPAGAGSHARWLDAALDLDRWMRARDYAGYDPHDLLNSRLIRWASLNSRWLSAAWTQVGKRSPIQLRPWLGVEPRRNAKGLGLVLASHVRLAETTGEARFRDSAGALADWLRRHVATGASGAAWGYPFPWANRAFLAPAGTPSSVVTAFVAQALLDAEERLGLEQAGALGRSAAEFIRRDLGRVPGPDGTFCFTYTRLDRRAVHNASLLAASLLARVAAATGDGAMAADALAATRFTTRAQRPDGSWPYGTSARDQWVDSFHTSYNLVALEEISRRLDAPEFEEAIGRGLEYWRATFFRGPAVSFGPHDDYPVDLHAVAHAILTLLALEPRLPGALQDAGRLADWSLEEMRDPHGFFYYQMHRRGRNRLPYMRWVQAWMLRALAELAGRTASAGADGGRGRTP